MKLWDKNIPTGDDVLKFTIGNDPLFDRLLAPYDIIGSMAHAIMLGKCGLLEEKEVKELGGLLAEYYNHVIQPGFQLDPEDEDIHSHLEKYLVKKAGDTGKKIHTARSRNDQVMTALQLMMKEGIRGIIGQVNRLFVSLMERAEAEKQTLIPGYTHTQVAMPSSVAVWLGAYAETLVNDLHMIRGALEYIDQNPLGSAAGYGSSFPIDRDLTTELTGFRDLMVSSASPQLNRGKMESSAAFGLASIAGTLSRLASDMIFYMSQEVNILSFPDDLTTGSSIMPHKKNPDVLELIRAHGNIVGQAPATLQGISSNLVSGYHRDFQLIKEVLLPSFDKVSQCLSMMERMVMGMRIRENILEDEKYRYIFSVEVLNSKVLEGKTFRDAYREVGKEIADGSYSPGSGAEYTHIGSIGNPGLERIREKMENLLNSINIIPVAETMEKLKARLERIQG
jgi:argininosuccinate lyase